MGTEEWHGLVAINERWPRIAKWAAGGTVNAPDLIAECRDVVAYFGGDPRITDEMVEQAAKALFEDWWAEERKLGGHATPPPPSDEWKRQARIVLTAAFQDNDGRQEADRG